MKTINLALKKIYFAEILTGEKTEEYRSFTDYYIDRLTVRDESGEMTGFKNIDRVNFFCGRYEGAPKMVVEVKEITLDPEIPWEKRTEENSDFVIVLGNILEKKNC